MEVMEDGNLMDKVNILIQRDMEYYNNKQSVLQEPICPGVVGGKLDFPRYASFAAIKIVLWWEEEFLAAYRKNSGFMKLADENFDDSDESAGGCGGVVKASDPAKFISAITKSSEQLLDHLHVLTQEALDHADLTVLTGTIGAAALIKNCLWCYIQTANASKPNYSDQLQTSLKKYQEMGEALAERLLDLHCRLLSLYILQDSECLDWENSKAFFESERGSYVIQMWWLYMKGTMEGLWNTVPPKMAQRVFSGMLNETLTILTVRYGQVTPSEPRAKLLGVDISNILLCVAQLLPSLCDNAEELIGLYLNTQNKILRDVHAKCQELFAFFVLRCSTLDFLFKTFRKGLENADIMKSRSNGFSPWIPFALPSIFKQPKSASKMSDLSDDVAISLELAVLLAQPQPHWSLLLKVLCMRDCKILVWILQESMEQFQKSLEFAKTENTPLKCDAFLCTGDGVCKGIDQTSQTFTPQHYYDIISSVTHVFLAAGNKQDLSSIFLPVIMKYDKWGQCFDRREIWNQIRPPWYQAIMEIVKPSLSPITKTVISAVQTGASMYQAMSIVLACFSQIWDVINPVVPQIAEIIQEYLPLDITCIGKSALLQLLLSALYTDLLHISTLEHKRHVKFTSSPRPSNAQTLSPTRESTHKNSITSFDGTVSTEDAIALAVAEALCSIDEDNKHTEQIVDFLDQAKVSLDEEVAHDGCQRVERTQQTIEILASDLLISKHGKRSLKVLYHFIKHNSEWLFKRLGVNETGDNIRPNKVNSANDSLIHTMFHIGYQPFDQLLSGSWSPDWGGLLRTPLGLTSERIWSHLTYRWEFNDTNYSNLSTSDAQIVATLSATLKPI